MIKIINYIKGLEEDIFDEIKEELDYIVREISLIHERLSDNDSTNVSYNLGLIDERDYPF